jgi:pyruvate dehydrogenase E1 component
MLEKMEHQSASAPGTSQNKDLRLTGAPVTGALVHGVLITGGYHTTNLKKLLKERNISYIVLTPTITHETNQKRYESILLNQTSVLRQNPFSLSQNHFFASNSHTLMNQYLETRRIELGATRQELIGEFYGRMPQTPLALQKGARLGEMTSNLISQDQVAQRIRELRKKDGGPDARWPFNLSSTKSIRDDFGALRVVFKNVDHEITFSRLLGFTIFEKEIYLKRFSDDGEKIEYLKVLNKAKGADEDLTEAGAYQKLNLAELPAEVKSELEYFVSNTQGARFGWIPRGQLFNGILIGVAAVLFYKLGFLPEKEDGLAAWTSKTVGNYIVFEILSDFLAKRTVLEAYSKKAAIQMVKYAFVNFLLVVVSFKIFAWVTMPITTAYFADAAVRSLLQTFILGWARVELKWRLFHTARPKSTQKRYEQLWLSRGHAIFANTVIQALPEWMRASVEAIKTQWFSHYFSFANHYEGETLIGKPRQLEVIKKLAKPEQLALMVYGLMRTAVVVTSAPVVMGHQIGKNILKKPTSARLAEKIKIAVFDKVAISESGFDPKKVELLKASHLSPNERIEKVVSFNPDILLIRGSNIDKKFMERLVNLKTIIRAGHGLDKVDLGYASAKSIKVFRTAGAEEAIAALSMRMVARAAALYLGKNDLTPQEDHAPASFFTIQEWLKALDNKIPTEIINQKITPQQEPSLRQKAKELFQPIDGATLEFLKSKTIGIIGYGSIGREIAKIAKNLGMTVWVNSPTLEKDSSPVSGPGYNVASKEEIYSQANFIALCTGLNPTTEGMIGKEAVALMLSNRDFIGLVNADREKLVSEKEIERLVNGKKIYIADSIPQSPELQEKILYTPHFGGSTDRGERNVVVKTLEILNSEIDRLAVINFYSEHMTPGNSDGARLGDERRHYPKPDFSFQEASDEKIDEYVRFLSPGRLIPVYFLREGKWVPEPFTLEQLLEEIKTKRVQGFFTAKSDEILFRERASGGRLAVGGASGLPARGDLLKFFWTGLFGFFSLAVGIQIVANFLGFPAFVELYDALNSYQTSSIPYGPLITSGVIASFTGALADRYTVLISDSPHYHYKPLLRFSLYMGLRFLTGAVTFLFNIWVVDFIAPARGSSLRFLAPIPFAIFKSAVQGTFFASWWARKSTTERFGLGEITEEQAKMELSQYSLGKQFKKLGQSTVGRLPALLMTYDISQNIAPSAYRIPVEYFLGLIHQLYKSYIDHMRDPRFGIQNFLIANLGLPILLFTLNLMTPPAIAWVSITSLMITTGYFTKNKASRLNLKNEESAKEISGARLSQIWFKNSSEDFIGWAQEKINAKKIYQNQPMKIRWDNGAVVEGKLYDGVSPEGFIYYRDADNLRHGASFRLSEINSIEFLTEESGKVVYPNDFRNQKYSADTHGARLVEDLIEQLGSQYPKERQKAKDELLRKGPEALAELREASKQKKYSGFRHEIKAIIKEIQETSIGARLATSEKTARKSEILFEKIRRGSRPSEVFENMLGDSKEGLPDNLSLLKITGILDSPYAYLPLFISNLGEEEQHKRDFVIRALAWLGLASKSNSAVNRLLSWHPSAIGPFSSLIEERKALLHEFEIYRNNFQDVPLADGIIQRVQFPSEIGNFERISEVNEVLFGDISILDQAMEYLRVQVRELELSRLLSSFASNNVENDFIILERPPFILSMVEKDSQNYLKQEVIFPDGFKDELFDWQSIRNPKTIDQLRSILNSTAAARLSALQERMPYREEDRQVWDNILRWELYQMAYMVWLANKEKTELPKVGGHQSAAASSIHLIKHLRRKFHRWDTKSIKPHAGLDEYVADYQLGYFEEDRLRRLRENPIDENGAPGLHSYPGRIDGAEIPTGHVGIGGAVAIALADLYKRFEKEYGDIYDVPDAYHVALMGDAEIKEANLQEMLDWVLLADLKKVIHVIDYNRQSLDGTTFDLNLEVMKKTYEAKGWNVIEIRWGSQIEKEAFWKGEGQNFKKTLESLAQKEYQQITTMSGKEVKDFLIKKQPSLQNFLSHYSDELLCTLVTDLAGHDHAKIDQAFDLAIASGRPTVIIAHTIKGWGLKPLIGRENNHMVNIDEKELEKLRQDLNRQLPSHLQISKEKPFQRFPIDSQERKIIDQMKALEEDEDQLKRNMIELNQKLFNQQLMQVLENDPDSFPKSIHPSIPQGAKIFTQSYAGSMVDKIRRLGSTADEKLQSKEERILKWLDKYFWIFTPDVGISTNTPNTDGKQTRYIDTGITESTAFTLWAAYGKAKDFLGVPLLPYFVGYDMFNMRQSKAIIRYAQYWGSSGTIVGTPSGSTLSPEGAQHQSDQEPVEFKDMPNTEDRIPAFNKDLDYLFTDVLKNQVFRIDQEKNIAYLRLTTSTALSDDDLDQRLPLSGDPERMDAFRSDVLAGGYRLIDHRNKKDYGQKKKDRKIANIFVSGIMAAEALKASDELLQEGIYANVVVITSVKRLTGTFGEKNNYRHLKKLIPLDEAFLPIVTVADASPSYLAGTQEALIETKNLGLKKNGLSTRSPLTIYKYHGINSDSIQEAVKSQQEQVAGGRMADETRHFRRLSYGENIVFAEQDEIFKYLKSRKEDTIAVYNRDRTFSNVDIRVIIQEVQKGKEKAAIWAISSKESELHFIQTNLGARLAEFFELAEKANGQKLLSAAALENIRSWAGDEYERVHAQIAGTFRKAGSDQKLWNEINDAWYTKIAPGTAGMRGKRGWGTNRINEYTLGSLMMAHALAVTSKDYTRLLRNFDPDFDPQKEKKAVILGGDSRHGSYDPVTKGPGHFIKLEALINVALGVPAYVYKVPVSTPQIAWSVHELKVQPDHALVSGSMNTASHNPKTDNGNKPYKWDGSQSTGRFAEILKENIAHAGAVNLSELEYQGLNILENVDEAFHLAVANGDIRWVGGSDDDSYKDDAYHADELFVKRELQEAIYTSGNFFDPDKVEAKNIKIVVSPLFGVSRHILKKVLKARGLRDDQIIWVQDEPNPEFPGVEGGKPNPEEPKARLVALQRAVETDADLILWTDPDSDRPAVAAKIDPKQKAGRIEDYISLNGNQQLAVLADYFVRELRHLAKEQESVKNEKERSHLAAQALKIVGQFDKTMMASTVVSGDLMKVIARNAGIQVVETLTGFKYIGDQIEKRSKAIQKAAGINERQWQGLDVANKIALGLEHSEAFLFGGEESLGSLSSDGPHDKDAISGVMWFVEIMGRLRKQGISLSDRLDQIYATYGYFSERFPMLSKGKIYDGREFTEAEAMEIIKAKEGPSILNLFRNTPPAKIAGKKVIAVLDFDAQKAFDAQKTFLFDAQSHQGLVTTLSSDLPSSFKKALGEIPVPQNGLIEESRKPLLRGIYSFSHAPVRGIEGSAEKLPKENFIMLVLEDGSKVIARPSGTEPVIKFYINARGLFENKEKVDQWVEDTAKELSQMADNVAKQRFPERFGARLALSDEEIQKYIRQVGDRDNDKSEFAKEELGNEVENLRSSLESKSLADRAEIILKINRLQKAIDSIRSDFRNQDNTPPPYGARLTGVDISEEEMADFKLYLAALLKRHRDEIEAGKHFSLSFKAGVFEFEPVVGEDGSLDLYQVATGVTGTPFVTLGQEDLRNLEKIRIEDPAALKARVMQGIITAIKLGEKTMLADMPLDDMVGDSLLNIALPLSTLSLFSGESLRLQVRYQLARLAEHHRARYGRNVNFYLYGETGALMDIVKEEAKAYSSFIQVADSLPSQGVVFVDVEDDGKLPGLTQNHLCHPTGKIGSQAVGNWSGLALLGIYNGRTASVNGKINVETLTVESVKDHNVANYNKLSIHPLDRLKYRTITSHQPGFEEDLLELMKNHLLQAGIEIPEDIDTQFVLAQLVRMAEQSV